MKEISRCIGLHAALVYNLNFLTKPNMLLMYTFDNDIALNMFYCVNCLVLYTCSEVL